MTDEQFVKDFQLYLEVGGPLRQEIVREVTSHLQEQSADQLGNPSVMAKKMNRVHLGLFASFQSLAITAAITTVLFDVVVPYVGLIYHGSPVWKNVSWISSVLWQFIPFISPLLFIYGAHAISRMRNRWVYTVAFAAIFTAGFAIQQELMQAAGYLSVFYVGGSQNAWHIHIQPVVTFFISYAVIGYGMLAISAGRQHIVTRHHIIDVLLAGILEGAAAYYIVPMVWNAITSFHYTEAMYRWSVAVYENLFIICVGIGLLGAGVEWYRIRATKKRIFQV
ncbi:MAG: hypothetical protein WC544_00035 [Patescibacteria group bacterium]